MATMPKTTAPQNNRQAKRLTINGQFSGWSTASRVAPTATCEISTDKVSATARTVSPPLCAPAALGLLARSSRHPPLLTTSGRRNDLAGSTLRQGWEATPVVLSYPFDASG